VTGEPTHEALELAQLEPRGEPSGPAADAAGATGSLSQLADVSVTVTAELGRSTMTIGHTLELRPGSIVPLHRMTGEPIDLLVNGRPIARGEVVVVDDEFGIRVTEVAPPAT
jgi:flagellar motor switch protein FliN/FliY